MKFTSSSEELKLFCDEIIKYSDYVAIDTEFVRINTYYPKLCLLQLAFKKRKLKKILIIDVFDKKIEFNPFINLLKNRKITKIIQKNFKIKKYNCILSISDEKNYSTAFAIIQT